jgi:hypothetical protein
MRVLFVGGTGRSGTTVLGRLLGAHPDYIKIPSESKFIAGSGGLCDLALGVADFKEFESRIRSHFFHNRAGRGLHAVTDFGTIEAALPRLRDGLRSDPWAAASEFAHTLLDPVTTRKNARAWVDMNPGNVFRGEHLLRLFPNMKLIHIVRDGRDVAASVTPLTWGPDDLDEALDWWASRVKRGFRASDHVPADRVLVVQMEDLFLRDREAQYARLLAFAGLDDGPVMHGYFDEHVKGSDAHIGRWRHDVPADRLEAFEARHQQYVDDLRRLGRPYAPVLPRDEIAPAA